MAFTDLSKSPYKMPATHRRQGRTEGGRGSTASATTSLFSKQALAEQLVLGVYGGGSATQRRPATAATRSQLQQRPRSAVAASPQQRSRPTSAGGLASPQRPMSSSKQRALQEQFQPAAYMPHASQNIYADTSHSGFHNPPSPTRSGSGTPAQRPGSARARPSRPHSPLRSDRGGAMFSANNNNTVAPVFCESSESRLHHLHLQCLHAAQQRQWPQLVHLRVEMLALTKLVAGSAPSSSSASSPESRPLGSSGVAPAVHLARLALADAYLRADQWQQAVMHAQSLPAIFEREMGYSQGSWDAHMLLGRACFALSRDAAAGALPTSSGGVDGPPSPSNSSSSSSASYARSESSRLLDRSCGHFRAALELSSRPLASFFRHTSIRSAATQRRLAHEKHMEASFGLAASLSAAAATAPVKAQEAQDVLTALWERADAFFTDEHRKAQEAQEVSESALAARVEAAASSSAPPPTALPARSSTLPHSLNDALSSVELYFYLGQSFFLGGDDINAADNLQRALAVARTQGDAAMARGLDEDLRPPRRQQRSYEEWEGQGGGEAKESDHDDDDDDELGDLGQLPHPSRVSYPALMLVLESAMLLAVVYARGGAERAQEALDAFAAAKRLLDNVREWNKAAAVWFAQSGGRSNAPPLPAQTAEDGSAVSLPAPAEPAPPTHTPSMSAHISHAAIDHAFQQLWSRECAWHFNVLVCYSALRLESFCARGGLRVAKEIVTLLLALQRYEEAAAAQEEVCALIEAGEESLADFTGVNAAEKELPDAASSGKVFSARELALSVTPSPISPSPTASGVFQLEVARAQRRLGDICLLAGQPRTAAAAYKFALQTLQLMHGIRKIHNVSVKHARHSSYSGGGEGGSSTHRAKRAPPPGSLSGFGSQTVALMRAQIAAGADSSDMNPSGSATGAEHGVPPQVLKLIAQLKQALRLLKERIRNETYADAAEAAAAADGEDEYAEDGFDNGAVADPTADDGADAAGQAAPSSEEANGAEPVDAANADADMWLPPQPAVASTSSPAKRRSARLTSSSSASGVPHNPHVGRVFPGELDQLSGASPVVAEGLALRVAAAALGEEQQARRDAYDAFAVEKETILHPTPLKQTRPPTANKTTAAAANPAAAAPTPADLLFDQQPPPTVAIDFSQFGNLDLA